MPNPPPPSNNSKYRETITSATKLSSKNTPLQKRYSYYDREDDEYSYVRSPPKRPPVLRQRYPSYDSFTNQNSRYGSSYTRPRSTYRRRHLNVAGDNIVSKSLTRNYIYHRQPFDWYNSSSGVLLDDVEEIVPVPGGLDEPHLNAPYERTASDDNEEYDNNFRNDKRNNNNYIRNNSYDSQKGYDYENQTRKKQLFRNFSNESLGRNIKQSIREPIEIEDEFNDEQYNRKIVNKPKDTLGEYEKEKKNKASQVFLDDEKKASELVLRNNKNNTEINDQDNIDKEDDPQSEAKKSDSLNENNNDNKLELQPNQVIINAQSVTINADSIKTNNLLTENDIDRILNKINENFKTGPTFFQPNRNNNINNTHPYQQLLSNYQNLPNTIQGINELNHGFQPNIQLPSIYNFSARNDLQTDSSQIATKNQVPSKPTSFQPFPRFNNKKSDDLVKTILKDIVTVASEDAGKIILNNPFDERTDVYKMLKDKSKSDLYNNNNNNSNLAENPGKNLQVFQNSKFVNNYNNNIKSLSSQTSETSFPSQENINALAKLTLSETEKLKKLCTDMKLLKIKK